MMTLGSAGIFSLRYPDEDLSKELITVADFVRREAG
jgi:hypothetical protein